MVLARFACRAGRGRVSVGFRLHVSARVTIWRRSCVDLHVIHDLTTTAARATHDAKHNKLKRAARVVLFAVRVSTWPSCVRPANRPRTTPAPHPQAVEARTSSGMRLWRATNGGSPSPLPCSSSHPLALAIVTGLARTRSLAEIVVGLQDEATRFGLLDTGDPSTSLPAVLSYLLCVLTREQQALFAQLGNAPGPDIGLPAAAALVELSILVPSSVAACWRVRQIPPLRRKSAVLNASESVRVDLSKAESNSDSATPSRLIWDRLVTRWGGFLVLIRAGRTRL
ncbi:hypothetical protein CLV68_4051 [Actinokineospora cianjurensis]|uniref:Uncharacterized protein n=1 Tax=Actinokineospora cianjurensis TaxID=585224 RepID=A0A421B0R9_9PSEU|nr:hypothetical protein CLV68_4051 [Actinokineospora cianjurensis]